MLSWNDEQKLTLERFHKLEDVPVEERKYKCLSCNLIVLNEHLEDGCCPCCKSKDKLKQMCPLDTDDPCTSTSTNGIHICPICGAEICPECGAHDVEILARVTGYYSPKSAWNGGKSQELKDRHRYVM